MRPTFNVTLMSLTDSPWIVDDWFSNQWNHLLEVAGSMCLLESLKVHDVTLRDGEQNSRLA